MKTTNNLITCLFVFFLASSCSKNGSSAEETETTPDRSKCLLSAISYVDKPEMPYHQSNLTLTYNAEKRISLKSGGGIFTEYTYQPGFVC